MFVTIPKPAGQKRWRAGGTSKQIKLYLQPGEKEVIQRAAHIQRVSVSEFFRQSALNVATAIGANDGYGSYSPQHAVQSTRAGSGREDEEDEVDRD